MPNKKGRPPFSETGHHAPRSRTHKTMNTTQQVLDAENLTMYGAAQMIGAETDEPLKTIHARWCRWRDKDPLKVLSRDLAILGYEIKIEKIKRES